MTRPPDVENTTDRNWALQLALGKWRRVSEMVESSVSQAAGRRKLPAKCAVQVKLPLQRKIRSLCTKVPCHGWAERRATLQRPGPHQIGLPSLQVGSLSEA